jgi:hypothetical protein
MLTALVVWSGVSFLLVVPVARLLHRAAQQAGLDEPTVPGHTAGDGWTSAGPESWENLPYRQVG